MKRPDGVTIIAVWYFVEAFFCLMFACTLMAIPFSGVMEQLGDPVAEFWVAFTTTCFVILGLIFAVALVLAGWGLLRMKQWARWLAFVLAIISLVFFPIGTIIGALIIWYLLKGDVNKAFEEASKDVYATFEPSAEEAEEA